MGAATARDNLGTSYWAVGDYDRAATIFEQNLALRRRIGDRRGEGASLLRLAMQTHYRGDLYSGRRHYQAALTIFQEIGYRRGEGEVLAHLCLLHHQLGEQGEAIAFGREAASIARANHDRSDLGYALTFLGHALAAAGEAVAARTAYEEALTLRRQLGEINRTMEPLAGLAELALEAGDRAGAVTRVEAILHHLETGTLDVVDEPARVYLAVARVLQATGDARATSVVRAGQALLQTRAGLLEEAAERFLALPLHQALLHFDLSSDPT
jgi:tetratricopeptide (TPR) repeat protein